MSAADLPELSGDWAFFLDVDGTLLEIAARPDGVRVDAAVRQLLDEVRAAAGGALALISGRTVADLDALFAPLVLPAAGQHGVERRDAAGRIHRHAFDEAPLRRVAAQLAAFARERGLLFENKGHALALHYRLAPAQAGAARAEMERAARELGQDFDVLAGKSVFELKPCGRDKGVAVEEYLAEAPFAGRTPVFVGDDVTDEFGFGVVNRLAGHSIKVGEGASAARWRLEAPAAVRAWIAAGLAHAARC